ncbi:SNF2 family N-terminal domain-containing protein [Pseudoneurospora amorphoporcata]|uniref:SNF2 family N-terminal domain-containing protein n=1 Tax=Pseudoneurospora amorphoporcata TaxID=241081 RepID=A0AAN6NSE7_9PEZI|nr:SNF2 family N-terminal domain-containing protein [Pseudoneurospora amorphoporcata]
MSSIHIDRFLAAGCIVINEAQSGISPARWALPLLHTWHSIDVPASKGKAKYNPSIGPIHIAGSDPPLHPTIQDALLESPDLSPFLGLLGSKRVHTTFRVTAELPTMGIVRVYILPDDVENRLLPRFNKGLQQLRATLFQLLDRSLCTWHGHVRCQKVENDGNADKQGLTRKSQSLLQIFNTLPSPNPNPKQVHDLDRRGSMYNLLANRVSGLKTKLYPFQCQSAASMVQRESQTEPVPDPRLPKRYIDHLGKAYYVDLIGETIVVDPAYYDSVCGGILAEEMGAGKTLICLALILATKHIPTKVPDIYRGADPIVRPEVGSLMDMAAAVVTRSGLPWKDIYGFDTQGDDWLQYGSVMKAIKRNPGWYRIPQPVSPHTRPTRRKIETSGDMVYLSHTSLIIVPANLVTHWEQEIEKHTSGLRVLLQTKSLCLPAAKKLKEYDIILFSRSVFDSIYSIKKGTHKSLRSSQGDPLTCVHFKRCIIDEGHVLGTSTSSAADKTNLQLVINDLHVDAKWVVTGTPSTGLYGLDHGVRGNLEQNNQVSTDMELQDLKKIGVMASVFLRARPWANTNADTQALRVKGSTRDRVLWEDYIVKPWASRTADHQDACLRATLGSLIVRHPKPDIVLFLPSVHERVIYLDGSYQDILSLNLFSLNIIFNAVLSQRTDQDYFFHRTQRKHLGDLVSNLRQTSFFGGQFFPKSDILQAIHRAERFLYEGTIAITAEDDALLRTAIEFGRIAIDNTIKDSAHTFAQIPLFVENFPYGAGRHWFLDDSRGEYPNPVCTVAPLLLRLQERLKPFVRSPITLDMVFSSGDIAACGEHYRQKISADTDQERNGAGTNKKSSEKNPEDVRKKDLRLIKSLMEETKSAPEGWTSEVAAPLAKTRLISTASAKLSYLVDQIIKHQEAEQILVFYENDNVAYYLAEVLEVLGIQHLIYAKGITSARKNLYLATFTLQSSKFRVMLMDISQAAYGLDMKTASRIYFINPVLNPQVGAQAIGRARRISQHKPVTVETLVLRGSIDEVIVRRREEMSPAEQRKCSRVGGSILDDQPIYNWILNAKILLLPANVDKDDGPAQMAKLAEPQDIFGRDSGSYRECPDQDLVSVGAAGRDVHRFVNARRKFGRDDEVTIPGKFTAGLPSGSGSNRRTYLDDDGVFHPISPMVNDEEIMDVNPQKRAEPDSVDGSPSKRPRVRFADTNEN